MSASKTPLHISLIAHLAPNWWPPTYGALQASCGYRQPPPGRAGVEPEFVCTIRISAKAVAVAQLVEWSLLTPEIRCSNPDISIILHEVKR